MDDFNIKLGVQNIPVIHKPSDELDDIDDPEDFILGRYRGDYPKPEIHIWNELDRPRYNEAFLHELVEEVNFQYCLDMNHIQIGVLGAVMSQVLLDNNLRFLTEREVEDEKV